MRKDTDERPPKVRLCSKCHVGIPHWLTNGHGSDFVKCENCGNEIQVPYCCRNYWTLWNKENKDGVLVSYTPSFGIRFNRTILDLAPKWEYESEQLMYMKKMDEDIRRIGYEVNAFSDRLKDIRDSYWLIPRDEPLTQITLAQYDEAMRNMKCLIAIRNRALEILEENKDVIPNYNMYMLELAMLSNGVEFDKEDENDA